MTAPMPRAAQGFSISQATRYLCAAAHLDERFANDVLARTLYERHRAIASSPGVDLAPVVAHCLAARRRRTARDVVLAVLVVAIAVAATALPFRLALVLAFFCWFVVLTEMAIVRYDVIGERLSPNTSGSDWEPTTQRSADALRQVWAELEEQQRGNLTVYSGFSPFVGSGFEIGGWSFAINVRRGKESPSGTRATPLAPIPFS
jgi:hypothetical protein